MLGQVQAIAGDTTISGSATLQLTLPNPGTAGNNLIYVVGAGSTGVITSVADNLGPTWTAAFLAGRFGIFYRESIPGGVLSATCTLSGVQDACGVLMERDDLLASGSHDNTPSQLGPQTGVTACLSNPATAAQLRTLAIGVGFSNNGGGLFTGAGGSFLPLVGTNIPAGSHDQPQGDSFFVELLQMLAGGTVTANIACNGGANPFGLVSLFKMKPADDGTYNLGSDLYF